MTTEAYLEFPTEGLAFAGGDLLRWMKVHHDPQLWHLLGCEMFHESPDHLDVLQWIVEQPDCDRATAAAIFVLIHGDEHIFRTSDSRLAWDAQYERLVATICHHVAQDFYTASTIADPSGSLPRTLDEVRMQLDTEGARPDREPRFPVPASLLAAEFPDASFVRRYTVEQDAVVRLDIFDDFVRSTFPDRWPSVGR